METERKFKKLVPRCENRLARVSRVEQDETEQDIRDVLRCGNGTQWLNNLESKEQR